MERTKPDHELFDASDVEYEIVSTKKRNEVAVVLKSATDFNTVKTYLSLKAIVESVERELGILDEAEGCH